MLTILETLGFILFCALLVRYSIDLVIVMFGTIVLGDNDK